MGEAQGQALHADAGYAFWHLRVLLQQSCRNIHKGMHEMQVRMQQDGGEWGEVMFVPSGALTQPSVPQAEMHKVESDVKRS